MVVVAQSEKAAGPLVPHVVLHQMQGHRWDLAPLHQAAGGTYSCDWDGRVRRVWAVLWRFSLPPHHPGCSWGPPGAASSASFPTRGGFLRRSGPDGRSSPTGQVGMAGGGGLSKTSHPLSHVVTTRSGHFTFPEPQTDLLQGMLPSKGPVHRVSQRRTSTGVLREIWPRRPEVKGWGHNAEISVIFIV